MPRKFLLASLLSLLLLALFFATPAHAVVAIVVNSPSDVISSSDNSCTLREAVIAVNTHTPSGGGGGECLGAAGLNTIILPSGAYTLTIAGALEEAAATGDLDLKQDMTIQGNGFGCLLNPNCTSINGNGIDRVIDITTTAHVTITNLDVVLGHEVSGFGGGGIRNFGTLILNDVYFSSNTTSGLSGSGGGLYNDSGAVATLDTVGFVLNHANNLGGAIANSGIITLTHNLFTFDTAGNWGGGLANEGTATLIDTTVADETATAFDGGGIYSTASLTLNRVTMDHNEATNGRGGGIFSTSAANLTNVTLSQNSAISNTSAGGAIYVNGGVSTLTHVTIYSNTATSGGGIYNNAGTVSLKSTIVTNSPTGGNCAGSAITSLGYNFDGSNTCAFSATGDITFTAALLGPLANNGGSTFTHALLTGSPALNKIPFGTNGCGTTVTVDQRGFARISPCDIGAFEYGLRIMLPLVER